MVKQETIDAAAKQLETLLEIRAGSYVGHEHISCKGVNALIEVLAEVRGKAKFVTDRQAQLSELCDVTTMSLQTLNKGLAAVERSIAALKQEIVK